MTSTSPASPESASTPISEQFARAALMVERYLLPWIYFWLASTKIKSIYLRFLVVQRILSTPGMHGTSWPIFWAAMTRDILLTCLCVFIGLTLFITRKPVQLPKNLSHLTIPVAMSFYFFLYPLVDHLPLGLRENLVPFEWRVPAAAIAVLLALTGYAISLWGLFYLRRSFAIFVAVRDVVSGGPYAHVRHPMYLGYIFELAGILLSSFSPAMLVLGVGFLLLMSKRAGLEEARLCEASPAYAEYIKRTGRFFPRLSDR
jgi:protein-S-isoprenylcysteine O-methyltransferase Ste14